MPFIFRRSKVSIRELEKEPPKSLIIVRKTVQQHVRKVLDDLAKLEKTYYGAGKNSGHEFQKWRKPIMNVIDVYQVIEIRSSIMIQDILKRASDPRSPFKVDKTDAAKLKECYQKVTEFVPDKFKGMISDIMKALKIVEKYCTSFYETENDPYLGTCTDYEHLRSECAKRIKKDVQTISRIAEKFKTPIGVGIYSLSTFAQELAARHDVSQIPFLLLFPEACDCIRNACAVLLSWITADENYSAFLKNDISELEAKQQTKLRLVREVQEKCYHASYKVHLKQSECSTLEKELDGLTEKEAQWLFEEEYLLTDVNELQFELDIKEFRRNELKRHAGELNQEVLTETSETLDAEIRDLHEQLPGLRKQLSMLQTKLAWHGERRTAFEECQRQLQIHLKESQELENTRNSIQVEFDSVSLVLDMAKQINLLKECSDTLVQQFHDLPVDWRSKGADKEKIGDLERAFRVIAKNIDEDWVILYRHLPFFPPRGSQNIEADIDELSHSSVRDTSDERALKSLQKWRRFHTRAKLSDLTSALTEVKMYEILHLVNEEINPTPVRSSSEDDPVLESMDVSLIPYYKEIRKFDKVHGNEILKPKLHYDYWEYYV